MKALVADKFEDEGLAGLRAAGCEVLCEPDLTGDALRRAPRGVGEQATRLGLIVRVREGCPDVLSLSITPL